MKSYISTENNRVKSFVNKKSVICSRLITLFTPDKTGSIFKSKL